MHELLDFVMNTDLNDKMFKFNFFKLFQDVQIELPILYVFVYREEMEMFKDSKDTFPHYSIKKLDTNFSEIDTVWENETPFMSELELHKYCVDLYKKNAFLISDYSVDETENDMLHFPFPFSNDI